MLYFRSDTSALARPVGLCPAFWVLPVNRALDVSSAGGDGSCSIVCSKMHDVQPRRRSLLFFGMWPRPRAPRSKRSSKAPSRRETSGRVFSREAECLGPLLLTPA